MNCPNNHRQQDHRKISILQGAEHHNDQKGHRDDHKNICCRSQRIGKEAEDARTEFLNIPAELLAQKSSSASVGGKDESIAG